MRWVFRGVLAIVMLSLAFGAAGLAQDQTVVDKVSQGSVTILTDGIADPNGKLSGAIAELAARLSEVGKLRVLPLMGRGGADNVRDLLHLRGIDFALLNSDILAFLDQTGEHPTARRKIRYVTQLAERPIYVIARKPVAGIDQLAGRKVAVLGAKSASQVTARTLFGLLRVEAEFTEIDVRSPIGNASLEGADAVILVGEDISRLRLGTSEAQSWSLLPVPASPQITKVYRPVTIAESKLLAAAGPVESVSVASVLAVFDWKSDQPRYQNVTNFIRAFFGAIGGLKRDEASAVWPEVDINASVSGWERYALADTLRKAVPEADAAVRPVARAQEPLPVNTDEKKISAPLRLLVANRPPLSGKQLPAGGLIGELLAESLRAGIDSDFAKDVWLNEDDRDQPVTSLSEDAADIAAPVEMPDCDQPGDLSQGSASVCDGALLSDPLFNVVVRVFTRADSDFVFDADENIAGRRICLPGNLDTSDLNRPGREWVKSGKITLVRPATLVECLGLVEAREADAVLTNELEGIGAVRRLGLSDAFRMAEHPIATHGLHAIVVKDNAKAGDFVAAINSGIARLKESGAYSAIVAKHLSEVWSPKGSQ